MSMYNSIYSSRYASAGRNSAYVSEEMEYAQVKEKLCFRVVNCEHNLQILEKLPHIRLEDLAAVFMYMPVPCGDARLASSGQKEGDETSARLICWHDMERWDISVDQIEKDTKRSTGRMHPAFFAPLRQILGLQGDPEEGEIPMYILSCIDARFGASVLVYPNVIPRLAERLEDSLCIIPSSVHELIILRARDVDDVQGLIRMIEDVNRTEVSPGEVLSDSLYYYRLGGSGITRIPKL